MAGFKPEILAGFLSGIHTNPRLTTVHFPRKRMAEAACKLLFRRIKSTGSDQKKEVILSLHLVIRESTAIATKEKIGR